MSLSLRSWTLSLVLAAGVFHPASRAGDFNGDGFDDLAIGAHASTPNPSTLGQGVVFVAVGGPNGPSAAMSVFAEGLNGMPGIGQTDDGFGCTVTVGDFDDDGDDDLAAYVAGKEMTATFAGRVVVLDGGPSGLIGASASTFHQDTAGIGGFAEDLDQFGLYMSTADYNGDGASDLTVGVPNEDLAGNADAGVIRVLFGADGLGVVTNGSMLIAKNDLPGVTPAAAGDLFGRSVGR